MNCLDCKFLEIEEYGCKGLIGETVLRCKVCNEVMGEMVDCEDFEDKDKKVCVACNGSGYEC